MKILYIEPDASIASLWLARLTDLSDCVTIAENERQIRAALDTSQFTLTVCGSGGLEILGRKAAGPLLRLAKRNSHSLICLAEQSDVETHSLALSIGFDDCVAYDCSAELWAMKHAHAAEFEVLQQRLAQAQKLEAIGELAAGIAHEINTPIQYVGDNTRFVQDACSDLASIIQCCQKLVDATDKGKDLPTAVEALRSSLDEADVEYLVEEIPAAIKQTLDGVDRVANIVRAMKEFSHPGASEMCLTDLAKAITNTVMVARNEWKYVAELETDFDPTLPLVPCLAGELNQVLLNLLVNSAHAIGESLGESPETKGKILVSTRHDHEHAEIRITDSGTGMPEEIIKRIFTPFFTTKAAGKGTGQGLAIAHSVITEKHSGTIHVDSELGRGTTFIIRLPLEITTETLDAVADDSVAVC